LTGRFGGSLKGGAALSLLKANLRTSAMFCAPWPLAHTRGRGRHDHRALYRRHYRRVRARGRRPALPGGDARTAESVCACRSIRTRPA
jgi:hypothetical protein